MWLCKYLYDPNSEFIIRGNINTDYLNENKSKQTERERERWTHQNDSSTAIDIILVDTTRLSSSSTSPIVNGLTDAWFLTNNIVTEPTLISLKQRTRKINNETTAKFKILLEN